MFKLLQLIHVGSLLNVVYKRLKYFELFVIVLDGNQKNHKFHMKNKTKATSAICQKNKMSQEILRRKPGLTGNLEDWSDKHWQKTCGVLIRQDRWWCWDWQDISRLQAENRTTWSLGTTWKMDRYNVYILAEFDMQDNNVTKSTRLVANVSSRCQYLKVKGKTVALLQ